MDYTAAVLRNKGVPVEVARVEQIAAGKFDPELLKRAGLDESDVAKQPEIVRDEHDNPIVEARHVRFDNNTLAEIEDRFGSIEQWKTQLEQKPFKTVRDTLALAWDVEPKTAGLMMLSADHVSDYGNALAGAWSLASGVDPTEVAKMLSSAAKLVGEQREHARAEMLSAVESVTAELNNSG